MGTGLAPAGENVLTMTSREIAEVTGKEHRNILRDCDRLNESYAKMALLKIEQCDYRADNGQVYREFRLTRMQTFDLMTGYDMELRIRVNRRWAELEQRAAAPQIRDPQTAALVHALVQMDAVKREQERQSRDIAGLREDVAVIEARTQPECRHFTVMGWARLQGRSLPLSEASALGRRCAVLSRERGLPIGDVKDPRFGKVHSYHDSVLRDVFRGTPGKGVWKW